MELNEMKKYLTNEDLALASKMSLDFAFDYLVDTIQARKLDERLASVLEKEDEQIKQFA